MVAMTKKYGKGKPRKKDIDDQYDIEEIVRPDLDEYRPYNELCRFADEFKLNVELDKPFPEMNQMMLAITDKDKQIIKKITLEELEELDDVSSQILNELGKKYK